MSGDDVPQGDRGRARDQEADREPADRREWWATLADDALTDETRTNRRAERWLLGAFALAVVLTFLVLVAHPGPLLP